MLLTRKKNKILPAKILFFLNLRIDVRNYDKNKYIGTTIIGITIAF